MPIEIDAMTAGDWPQVAEIYRQGLETGNASFETEVPAPETWDAAHLPEPRLIARLDGAIAGWAALSPVSGRCVYGGVAEVSVYVAAGSAGRGVGRRLLSELVRLSEEAGIWTLQAGIFPENTASLALHRAAGVRTVGIRERVGRHLTQGNRWRDVVFIERRSPLID